MIFHEMIVYVYVGLTNIYLQMSRCIVTESVHHVVCKMVINAATEIVWVSADVSWIMCIVSKHIE